MIRVGVITIEDVAAFDLFEFVTADDSEFEIRIGVVTSEELETAIEEGRVELHERVFRNILIILWEETWLASLLAFGLYGVIGFAFVVKDALFFR